MNAGVFIVDKKNTIHEINQSLAKLFKAESNEIINKDFYSLFPDFDIKNIEETIIEYHFNIIKRDLFITNKENEKIYVNLSVMPLYTKNKKYNGFLGTCIDVTDKVDIIDQLTSSQMELRRRISEAAEERDKFHLVIENISDGVIVMNDQYQIYHFNSPVKNILGVSEKQLTNAPLKKYLKEIYFSDLIRRKKYFQSEEIEYANKKEGVQKILMIYLAPIITERGEGLNYVLTIRDVTKERQIDEMKTQFVSNVSHELRTPLASIKGFTATLLERKGLTSEQKKRFLKIIDNESDRLTRLIEDLLSLSRIEASTFKLQLVEFNLIEIMESIKQEFENHLKKKNLELIIHANKKDLAVIADRDKIYQLILNLVSNAIKFTYDNTCIEVKVSFHEKDDFFMIIVKDHGMGVSKEDQQKIFEKFIRIENAVHTIPGTGLGLSIVKSIVERHQGEIDIKSAVGKGTSFVVKIPQGKLNT